MHALSREKNEFPKKTSINGRIEGANQRGGKEAMLQGRDKHKSDGLKQIKSANRKQASANDKRKGQW